MDMDMEPQPLRPHPLIPAPLNRNQSHFPMPPSPGFSRFPRPSTANSRPSTANSYQRPSPPQSSSFTNHDPSRFPTHPSSNMARFPVPPPIPQSSSHRRPKTPNGYPGARYPTPPIASQRDINYNRRPTTSHSNNSNFSLPRYPTPPQNEKMGPRFQNTRSTTMPNMPTRPPEVLNAEQEDLARRMEGSYLANEEDALRAEAVAKQNYEKLEAEMVMARKFRKDNAREKKKIEGQMIAVREKLQALRGSWEGARVAMEQVRAREREMTLLRAGLERGGEGEVVGVGEVDVQRRRGILSEHIKQVMAAKENWEQINGVKVGLIEEDKALKDLDGRRQRRFDGGIEGHDKRRFAMRSRMARACHYAIYHAKRAHNYRVDREKLIPDPQYQEAQAGLEATMERAESFLKGPIDEDSGERFWKMHARRSWWTKIPEGPLGSPPSP